jgi:hypothetical protein
LNQGARETPKRPVGDGSIVPSQQTNGQVKCLELGAPEWGLP